MKNLSTLFVLILVSAVCFSQITHKSIHQEQSETYSKYNFTSEKEWDALRVAESEKSSELKKNETPQICTLNKRVFGWNPYWAGSAYNNYRWNLLSDLCHFSYEVDAATGNAISTHGWATDAAVTTAKNNGVKIHLCATLFSNHATFLTNSTAKQTFITNMINLMQSRGGNGVNIDFEAAPASQSANITAFMIDLCNQMHAANPNYEVSIALPSVDWSAVWDVNAMKNYVDLFIIMGYDYYYSGSATAGPSDPLYNFQTSYNYTHTKSISYYLNKGVPNAKLLLGLPYYGEEWPTSALTIPSATTGTGSARFFYQVKANSNGYYSNPQWDANSYSVYYAFNNGGNRQLFLNSGYSLGKRFDVVNQFGIGGIGIWALSYDDGYTDYWDKIRDKFSDCGTVACVDTIFDMGGPNRNYYDNEKYTYTIAPTGATSVSLVFSSFSTEVNYDSLWIYDGTSTASPLIGSYTGTNSPGTINSTGAALTLRWKSDGSTVNSGWKATWNCASSPPSNLSVTQNNCPSIGVVLNWNNSGNGWFVDVTDDPTFTNFWNKDVSSITTIGCPGGFANINVPTNYLQFKPNTIYYWRIWNGSTYTNGTSFTTPVCATTDTVCSGTLDDSGGPSASYGGNEDYTYTIAPVFATSVSINFTSFDLENGYDSLYIHDGTSTASPLIGGYTGTTSPGTINSTGGALTVHFVSDPFVNNAGFTSTWTCVQNTGLEPVIGNQLSVEVYPNPSHGEFTVYGLRSTVDLEVYNVLGERIFFKTTNSKQETVNLSGASGIYFLKLKNEQSEKILKLVTE
ncbi:MAG: T9SS type A sorting domain-containing protein [Bacteroidetes bacterium]|nr:T9SS type A sorting domain-containing protein [Bacteroidota bacterium]